MGRVTQVIPVAVLTLAATVLFSRPDASEIWRQPAGKLGPLARDHLLMRAQNLQVTAGSGLQLDRRGLVQTFADEFTTFSWHADEAVDGQRETGTWRTNFGYAGVNDRGSRTLPSNGEQQIYVDRAFRGTASASLGLNPFHIVDGVLEIIADRASAQVRPFIWDYPYTSGLITTRGTLAQQYGVFEIRARIPKGRGLWTSVWLLPAAGGWPPEIDILEILGHQTDTLVTTWHSNASGQHTMGPTATKVPDASADFHVYALDWNEDQIRWYFDGSEVARAPTPADLHTPMYLLINLAVGGYWPGTPDSSTAFPAALAIDWVRVYKRTNANPD
jgi:beta-glucanase (GH16 family)